MKLHINYTLLVALWVVGFTCSALAGTYNGGSGEPNDPYQIGDVNSWQELMNNPDDWDNYFLMTVDIDLAGVNITPIAPDTNDTTWGFQGTAFTGIFDGNNHVIRNATINLPSKEYIGLFGCVDSNGLIKNLGVEDINIIGLNYVGGLVGWNDWDCHVISIYSIGSVVGNDSVGGLMGYNHGNVSSCNAGGSVSGNKQVGGLVGVNWHGNIISCHAACLVSGNAGIGGLVGENIYDGNVISSYATGTVNGGQGSWFVGGLVGENGYSNITSCYASGSVSGGSGVGGLVGERYYGRVIYCYASGSVIGVRHVGGLAGINAHSDGVTSCYATGKVRGSDEVGGLVGYNDLASEVTSCYASGSVIGDSNVGGLVGKSHFSSLTTASFWDIETSGCETSAGGTPKTTAEMKIKSTFTEADWDFIRTWGIVDNQTYPFLTLIYPVGDLNYDKAVNFLDLAIFASHWLEDNR